MESNHWTEIGLQNAVLRLHESVLNHADKDVKYCLEHKSGHLIAMTPVTAVREMATGEYKNWMGPFDEVKVDRRIEPEDIVFRRRPIHTERRRTDEELQIQIKQVRKTHIRI